MFRGVNKSQSTTDIIFISNWNNFTIWSKVWLIRNVFSKMRINIWRYWNSWKSSPNVLILYDLFILLNNHFKQLNNLFFFLHISL